jgi:ribosome-associated protein
VEAEFVSRTKKKERVEELQKLGVALVALAPAQLEALALPPELLVAVLEAQRIGSHEARRRQLQYIGKIMRKVDPEPVRAALATITGRSAVARAQQMRLESWRERLIGDDGALTEYASAHPGANLQGLRAAIRNARKEIAEAKPPRGQRELFRLLRASDGSGDD